MDPWVWKIPWRREWQPTAVFMPGESHGKRNLMGYCPWGCKESDRPVSRHPSDSSRDMAVSSTCWSPVTENSISFLPVTASHTLTMPLRQPLTTCGGAHSQGSWGGEGPHSQGQPPAGMTAGSPATTQCTEKTGALGPPAAGQPTLENRPSSALCKLAQFF